MKKIAAYLVVAALIALLPLRALAAVTIGFCPFGGDAAGVVTQDDHGAAHGSGKHHEPAPQPATGGGPDCNACVEHCASTVSLVSPPCAELRKVAGAAAFPQLAATAPSFVADFLDPPPVAL